MGVLEFLVIERPTMRKFLQLVTKFDISIISKYKYLVCLVCTKKISLAPLSNSYFGLYQKKIFYNRYSVTLTGGVKNTNMFRSVKTQTSWLFFFLFKKKSLLQKF